jgi:hypothetical protein
VRPHDETGLLQQIGHEEHERSSSAEYSRQVHTASTLIESSSEIARPETIHASNDAEIEMSEIQFRATETSTQQTGALRIFNFLEYIAMILWQCAVADVPNVDVRIPVQSHENNDPTICRFITL